MSVREPWIPDEPIETKEKALSPFRVRRAVVRGCSGCCSLTVRNVVPEWDGKKWVCPECGYHFIDPPTYVDIVRCFYCGDPKDIGGELCRPCAGEHRRANSRSAAVNRYQGTDSDRCATK